jgi:hypothetical protein
VERSKAAEAIGYLSAVRSAQERYLAQNGTYASSASNLDITYPPLKYFSAGNFTVTGGTTGDPTWTLTLTRTGSNAYNSYTVVFTDQGYDTSSTINNFPEINPVDISGTVGS